MEEHRPITEEALVGRRIVAVDLENVADGYVRLGLDDDTTLEVRTSKVGQLLLSSVEDAGLRP
jgi:hypothetical protein